MFERLKSWYRKLPCPIRWDVRLTLIGYYGARNIGDDLMLDGLIRQFEESDSISKIYVFSGASYYARNGNKTSFVTPNMRLYRLRKLYAVLVSRCVIWGGGTCLYEASDNMGLTDIARWQLLAHFMRTRFAFLGIGIGDVSSDEIKKSISSILNAADYICFRENDSLMRAKEVFHCRQPCALGGDLVFLRNWESSCSHGRENRKLEKISFSGVLGIDVRHIDKYASLLLRCIEQNGSTIYFLPAHQGNHNDNNLHRLIANRLPADSFVICEWNSPDDYLVILSKMNFHIGMRLHSIILADLLCIPNLAISYSPKVESYIKKSGVLPELRLTNLDANMGLNQIEAIIERYWGMKESLQQFIEAEKMSAQTSVERLQRWCEA